MNVKITYHDGDNSIFTGVAKIVERNDGMGTDEIKCYSLYSEEGLLYSVDKIQVKEITIFQN